MRDLAFFGAAAILFPIALWSPHVGVLLWIWTALLGPNEYLYGFMAEIPFNKIAAAVTIGTLLLSREPKRFYLDGALKILLAMSALVTASALDSIVVNEDVWSILDKFLKAMVLVFLFTGIMHGRHRIHVALITVALSLGFSATWEGTLFLVTAGSHRISFISSVGDNNHAAVAYLMILPILFYLHRWSDARLARIVFLIVACLDVLAILSTDSRGGFIGLVCVLLAFVTGSRRKGVGLLAIMAVGAMIYLAAPASWFSRIETINVASQDNSFMGRVVAWKINTLIALDNPLLGGGLHASQRLAVWSHYGADFARLWFIPTDAPEAQPRAAHSIWFEMLGDLGFTGLALFVGLIVTLLLYCRQIRRLARDDPSLAWAGDLASMLQLSVVGYIVAGSAVSMGYTEIFYVIAALVSRTRRTALELRAASAAAAADPTARIETLPPWRRGRVAAPVGAAARSALRPGG
jgi:probable O-glycosylation ligase (exosortase A-associated)